MSKIYFITGASKGFGYQWAKAALEHGHKVVATARDPQTLADLQQQYPGAVLPLRLDVTDREACFATVQQAQNEMGRIDVLISNAGYGHFGFVEETTETEARNQIETNVFGSLWVIQAVLPIMRHQRAGHIVQVSSIGGVIAFPNLGIYHASKWAVEGLCESLAQEVADFGVHVTLVEPGPFTTEWSQSSAVRSEQNPEYADVRARFVEQTRTFDRGNPDAAGEAMITLTHMETPPLRLMLGRMAWKVIEPAYARRVAEWKQHLALSDSAHELTAGGKSDSP